MRDTPSAGGKGGADDAMQFLRGLLRDARGRQTYAVSVVRVFGTDGSVN